MSERLFLARNATETAVTTEKREFWDRLMPATSKKVSARKYHGLSHGGIVYNEQDGKTYLKYYSSHAATTESRIDIETLQTGRSENDTRLKLFVYGFQFFLAAASVALLFLDEGVANVTQLFGFEQTDAASVAAWTAGIFALILFLLSAYIWFNVRVHFNDMNTEWVGSVKGIVGLNMTALLGKNTADGFEPGAIAACLLNFRRFIKWRRYMNFFEPLLYVSVALQLAAFAFLLLEREIAFSWLEIASIALCGTLQIVLYFRISYLRWYWTKWRDPTVQLCLAFAELDRQLWVCKHPAAPGHQHTQTHAVAAETELLEATA